MEVLKATLRRDQEGDWEDHCADLEEVQVEWEADQMRDPVLEA